MVIVCVCVSINSVAVRHTFKIIVNPSRVGKRDFRKLKVIDKKYFRWLWRLPPFLFESRDDDGRKQLSVNSVLMTHI